MIRPNEAAGLTAGLARSIDLKCADLNILIGDDTYYAELRARRLTPQANAAQASLIHAEQLLRGIANALAAPPEPEPAAAGQAAARSEAQP